MCDRGGSPAGLSLRVLALGALLVTAACGGSEPPPSTASDCFNPALYAVGASYELDYQLSGAVTGTRHRSVTVSASSDFPPADRYLSTVHTQAFNPPVPGQTIPTHTAELLWIDGFDIVTARSFFSRIAPDSQGELPTVYDPPVRDQRYSLSAGESFTMLVRGQLLGSPVTTSTVTVRYVGQESVTVPAGTYTACRFEEQASGGNLVTTWVIKAKGVLAKRVEAGTSEELTSASRLNGQPI